MKKLNKLKNRLLLSYLLLALLPLLLIAALSYQQASEGLKKSAHESLLTSSYLGATFISNWFEYRFMDVKSQAESIKTSELLSSIEQGIKQSGQSPTQYVYTNDWILRVNYAQKDLMALSQYYYYIDDLFLIDNNGNVLYSITQGNYLGENLFTGALASSKFSRSVLASLQKQETTFSGLEILVGEDESEELVGFISAPIRNPFGKVLGAFVVQIDVTQIFSHLATASDHSQSLSHYLVAEDGRLQSPIKNHEQQLFNKTINTLPFHQWLTERHNPSIHNGHSIEEYSSPTGKKVLGIHQSVQLGNLTWLLISEIEVDEALASMHKLATMVLMLILLVSVIIFIIATIMSKKITSPISLLAKRSQEIADGQHEQFVIIKANDEIGQLSDAFNNMLKTKQQHERKLINSNELAQQALLDLNQQQFALDQHANVSITDLEGKITYVNDNLIKSLGYSRKELLGGNHRLIKSGIHPPEFFQKLYSTIQAGKVWTGEVCNKSKSSRLVWMDSTVVPFKDKEGNIISYIAIRTNITDRKQAEEKLLSALARAEQASMAKSEFLATMSHEIRTPMNGVLGMLGLLQNTNLNPEQQRRASIAQSSAQSLLTLINDILDYSKVDAGKLELEHLDFNLHTIMSDFIESMAYQAQNKQLELILDLSALDQTMVMGDPGRLRQVLTNLVGNAIKFTEQGEIVIRASLVDLNSQGWQLNCSITDTGIGIPEDKQDLLFDSFSQVDASTTRQYGGTGLGLAIVKKLTQLMGGNITVSSRQGKGSCFAFSINLQKSQHKNQKLPQVDMKSLNLLIVDDNATNREVICGQLEAWGANVTEAHSGAQALELCETRASAPSFFDVAFLDMQMPEMDGAELGKKLQADPRFKDMKLVMMTSMSQQGDAAFFADLGFSAYFPKPTTTSDLFEALSVVAEGDKALQQAQPLVTKHYLKTLSSDIASAANNSSQLQQWPEHSKILLVEDNQVNQLVATGILHDLGLKVDIAANGKEALLRLQKNSASKPYSLVLMDCQMPEMDGYEASRQIRAGNAGERYNNICIIAMTANAMVGDKQKCLEAGMDDYLAKPIHADLLFKTLSHWLLDKNNKPLVNEPNASTGEHSAPTVWDKQSLQQRTKLSDQQLVSLLYLFLKQMPNNIKALQQACEQQDIEQIYQQAHAIKGAAANISGQQLQQQAEQVESLARAKDIDASLLLLPKLINDYQILSDCLNSSLGALQPDTQEGEQSTVIPSQEFNQQLIKQLEELKTNLVAGEYIEVDELHFLQQHDNKTTQTQKLTQLSELIAQFDCANSLELIEEIIQICNLNKPEQILAGDEKHKLES